MEIVSYGKAKAEADRERNTGILLGFCRSHRRCRRDGRRCPLACICYSHPLGYLVTDFTEKEIAEAFRLIAEDGGYR